MVAELDDPPARTLPAPGPAPGQRTAYLEPSPHDDGDRLQQIAKALREAGWDIYIATRFDGGDVLEGARADWAALSRSALAVVDVRGPETPPGAAMVIGACAAATSAGGRPVYAPDPGGWWTFADGREPNFRNLMIQYGLTGTYRQAEQLIALLDTR